jgi:hypothetical protein
LRSRCGFALSTRHTTHATTLATPEGGFLGDTLTVKGQPAAVAWGSNQQIANAIKSFESNGDLSTISNAMGRQHKVRSFYNNIADPNNPNGHVTVDTHAIAAGLLRPLAAVDPEVEAGLGLGGGAADSAVHGVKGLYAHYADAFRQAAAERGIQPRQMQSVTWEAIRGLFPAEFKTAANKAAIAGAWNEYRAGRLGIDQVRNYIRDLAGGVRAPDWYGK